MQAKSIDELLCRLIEERDGKKLDATSVNLSSSFFAVSFTQINPHTSGPSTGGTSMSNPSARTMNHFHSRTTIESSATTFGMLQQATVSIFVQGYTHTVPSFSMPNPGSVSYISRYTTVAYTDPIPLPGSLLCFLPNHIYRNMSRFNAYGQLEAGGFGYETLSQFPL
jgi:hypothetical protein